MSNRNRVSRRQFLSTSSRAAAAIGLGSTFARTAVGEQRKIGANDRVRVGVVGSGGQGGGDMQQTIHAGNVECVALCDVAEFRLEQCHKLVESAHRAMKVEGVKIDHYADFRALLDRKDIDAVILALPDHWHKPPFIAACEAGKHIYQEKPFSFTIEDGFEMLAAAQKQPKLAIQIGTQRRSNAHYNDVKKYIDDGKIGDVTYVRAYDCRNFTQGYDPFSPSMVASRFKEAMGKDLDLNSAKIDWNTFQGPCKNKVSYDPVRYTAWRWYWDYAGGLVTDVGVHVIDNIHWLLGEPTPKSAVCNGGVYALKYWETPDVVNAVWDYGKYTVVFTGSFTNGFEEDGYAIFGTKGTVKVTGNDVKIYGEGDRTKPVWQPERRKVEHQHNWIECIRTGEKTNAPVELGVSSLLPSHMANLSYRSGRKITWDPETKKAT